MASPNTPIVLLRAAEDAAPLAEKLRAEGKQVILNPLIYFEKIEGAQTKLEQIEQADALILTSPHGLDGITLHERFASLPTYCVGARAEEKLRAAGATSVRSFGEVATLLPILERDGITAPIYLRGEDITQPIEGAQHIVTYRAVATKTLTEELRSKLNDNSELVCVITSERILNLFNSLLKESGLHHCKYNLFISSISRNLRQKAADLLFHNSVDYISI